MFVVSLDHSHRPRSLTSTSAINTNWHMAQQQDNSTPKSQAKISKRCNAILPLSPHVDNNRYHCSLISSFLSRSSDGYFSLALWLAMSSRGDGTTLQSSSEPSNGRLDDRSFSLALRFGRCSGADGMTSEFASKSRGPWSDDISRTPHLHPQSLRAVDLGAILTPQQPLVACRHAHHSRRRPGRRRGVGVGLLKAVGRARSARPHRCQVERMRENWITNAASA